jgi:hypothetical protein
MRAVLLVLSGAAFAVAAYCWFRSMRYASTKAGAHERIVTFGPDAAQENFTERGLRYRRVGYWSRWIGFLLFLAWEFVGLRR